MIRMVVLLTALVLASNARATDCATNVVRFERFVSPILARCVTFAGRAQDAQMIDQAREMLINAHIVGRAAFEGVDIGWCDLTNSSGMVPDRDRVLLHPGLKGDTVGLAVVLAHEMKHVEQYRRWGSDDFKCRYVDQLIKGNGHGRSNGVEAEAYEFGDRALQILQAPAMSPRQ
ncbi:hypothetical protein BH10PSE6_BH10PSE6_11470 [soil metagenome]